ncbi:phospho-N-acetylmuramoyl-pentapeptide-transferase [Mobilicoccus massiliensis]|uniref:phospho-N-acetylmuramoyl-pentapeptide- transferase n=1 Tax=Mobilicoccus massiliensis TaxID=1522310 RepID=UPI00058F52C8|nr:phospho-N-acetylmuramoyl-pentapeptide-transferase [Mobilicoccus massiliensis]
MKPVLAATAISLVVALFGTPLFIKFLVRRGYGQFIRDDGPTTHHTKRGTPTMGGAVIIGATMAGYFLAHLVTVTPLSASALLVMFLMVGMGFVGFADDFIKISKARSLGLRSWQKLVGQVSVGTVFAVLALTLSNERGITPASTRLSFLHDLPVDLFLWGPVVGFVLFVLWINLLIAGTSNGVNLTDGLDGLATGATVLVSGAYVLIGIWQFNQRCSRLGANTALCYETPHPLDLAIFAAALMGACVGFLWWNASPAKIFMGDTGSLALGGALAGLAITTRTELLMIILGGLFVIITMSVIIQVASFKMTGKRVFRMAPLQHHFELKGWNEVTIVIRFWIVAGVCVGFALALFYTPWIVVGGTL